MNSSARVLITLIAVPMLIASGRPSQERPELQKTVAPANAIFLDSLDVPRTVQDQGSAGAALSTDKNPITLGGARYPHGVGMHANAELAIRLNGAAKSFASMVGVDDETRGRGSVTFEVWADGRRVAAIGRMKGGEDAKFITVDLTGAKTMTLVATDAADGNSWDHADWAGAMIFLQPGATFRPVAFVRPEEPAPPIEPDRSPRPAINAPRITGATPGRPFLFLIPASGERPLHYSVTGLPAGLNLDASTGIISGKLEGAGEFEVELTVGNRLGTAHRKLTIVGGEHKLALTPPMGWNSWNVWAKAVDQQKVERAADMMVKTGLAAHGFQYVNIDDTWEAGRSADGEIESNQKFPDMKGLADYVHGKGLKIGIYSSPGPQTCAKYEGTQGHENLDAATYAKWGFDYLKYDWCTYRGFDLKKPYQVMRASLDKADRDIVFSLCQYGMGNVWEWGADVGGNLWRTTGDITDTWSSLSKIGFSQNGREKYAGPGHWNDPDMLIVGKVGWGPSIHPTRLKPNEQITHITLWSMLAAPLLIGCDLTQLDDFTLALLTNSEVLDVDQDPLGHQARRVSGDGAYEVWARPLWDGTTAVALFNRRPVRTKLTAKWSDFGIEGSQPVRDLWLHKNLGRFDGSFSTQVPRHGAVLLKIGTSRATEQ